MSRNRNLKFYLHDILDCGRAISAYVVGFDLDSFRNDPKTVDACLRRLEIIGEAVKNLPEEWKDTEQGIPWHAIAGFRNILAHAYFQIEEEMVWKSIENDLRPLMDACQRIDDRF